MRASNEYPSMRHSMMAFERFAADELKARASDLYWTGERYQNGPMQACWTVWQHCCTITPTTTRFTREELVQILLDSWEMQQGKMSPLTKWLAEDTIDALTEKGVI